MLPKSVKKRLPTRHDVQKNKYLQFLGTHLHSPNLWHFNRRSVARATAIGIFCAYLPMPFEMIPAAIGAIVRSSSRRGARKGARIGVAVGATSGAVDRSSTYRRVYDDCMRGHY